MVLLITVVLFSFGCSATNISELIKAAGQDPATVCARVTSVYGTLQLARSNITNGNIVCNSDGLTVKSDAAQVGVPITVVPQVSVGAPVAR